MTTHQLHDMFQSAIIEIDGDWLLVHYADKSTTDKMRTAVASVLKGQNAADFKHSRTISTLTSHRFRISYPQFLELLEIIGKKPEEISLTDRPDFSRFTVASLKKIDSLAIHHPLKLMLDQAIVKKDGDWLLICYTDHSTAEAAKTEVKKILPADLASEFSRSRVIKESSRTIYYRFRMSKKQYQALLKLVGKDYDPSTIISGTPDFDIKKPATIEFRTEKEEENFLR